ncbi:MAG: GvpL/GvpF family gas vesicle protein [Bacteroidota bacterium]
MSDPSHERDARALLGDLLVLIAQREEIREMLGDLGGDSNDRLLKELVDELQNIIRKRREELRESEPDESTTQVGVRPPDLPGDLPPTPQPSETGPDEISVVEPGELAQVLPIEPLQENEVPLTKRHLSRIPFDLDEEDYLYLHGVTTVPLIEKPASKPFMLEEKGIENSEFAFALDRGGLRFFLSRVTGRSLNVSKTGMLLFNKQESIRMRGLHETIVNELRGHGVVLPFEFGTVALGLKDLFGKLDAQMDDLCDAVDELMATTWWTLSAFMLDAKLAQVLRAEAPSVRPERERARQSYASTPPSTGRLDIKTLERILGKQKKIAESIHGELCQVAERSEVEAMVGLGSGTIDDWKLILKASYEVRPTHVQQLSRVITDIQYRHFLFELMLSLTGDRDSYSFQGS